MGSHWRCGFQDYGNIRGFYQTLLGFVNFRLYTSIGLVYPPKFDKNKDDQGAGLGAFALEGNGIGAIAQPKQIPGTEPAKPDPKLQKEIDKLMSQLNQPEEEAKEPATSQTLPGEEDEEEQATDTIDKFEPAAPGGDILLQPSYSATDPSTLFSNFTFFLSRETPRQPIEFILKAFGCKRIGWDSVLGEGAYTHNELDPAITHQIVDRPPIQVDPEEEQAEDNQTAQKLKPGSRVPGRIYVQPQWIWDSVNDEELKRPDLYAPGAQLPPHLSPFVKKVRGQYDPSAPMTRLTLQLREWMLQVLRMTTLRKPRKMMMPAHSVDSLMPKKRRKTRLLRLPSGDSASSRQNSLASHWKRRMSTQEPRRRLTPARRLRRDLRKKKRSWREPR